ncbi:hypothetical protein P167DRAFT_550421 [Morchella conica CCBAS932]|uniref:Uncharacterized protein n=1 Tax=Morchella conica CCBAS932 TaxID=1392247 RepID=A0A3N4K846_9PEZI|nr:hypothetical protein P167DRAFT_550421 [Morchella conica CCBAS932]
MQLPLLLLLALTGMSATATVSAHALPTENIASITPRSHLYPATAPSTTPILHRRSPAPAPAPTSGKLAARAPSRRPPRSRGQALPPRARQRAASRCVRTMSARRPRRKQKAAGMVGPQMRGMGMSGPGLRGMGISGPGLREMGMSGAGAGGSGRSKGPKGCRNCRGPSLTRPEDVQVASGRLCDEIGCARDKGCNPPTT